ncbi:MAG: hypothetical protein HFJ28_01720 [Clostridia bacterium]|jgi:hypothetical protein|nr:hypothetical protein [Clostridia bacterium]
MKNPKVIYILIGIFCVVALVAGIYAQFFVDEADKNNIIIPNLNHTDEPEVTQKTQEELKAQLTSLFTNSFYSNNYDFKNIQKYDARYDIVYTAHHIEKIEENYEIKIDLPVINIVGDMPTEFNNITQTVFADKATEILNGQNTVKTLYNVSYAGFINGDILSLVIQSTLKEGNNPQRVIVQTYNYNLVTGQKIDAAEMIAKKNIVQSEAQNKIKEVVKKAGEEAQTLVQSGYSVYNRDLSNKMYQIENITTYFLGPNEQLYIIFAYGNNNFTSEMDIIWYE